jgi:hypothetical protein
MMTSFASNIPIILETAAKLNPKRILDCGGGFGKFALLLREALLSIRAEKGDLIPSPDFEIDCIESCFYFQNLPWHRDLYDHHHHGDLFALPIEGFANYDLILMIDIIEHDEKQKFLELLRNIRATSQAKILISTPRGVVFYTEAYYGSDCPKHRSQWGLVDFAGFAYHQIASKDSLILLLK